MESGNLHPDQSLSKQARYSRKRSSESSNVGDIPPVGNPVRRRLCERDLLLFLQWYFPDSTGISAFSTDHLRVIHRMESAILHGGRALNAVYRGFAKTSITEGAAIWATLYGHRRSILIVAASLTKAKESNDSIQSEFENNERLADDFPEVCQPVQHLAGRPQGASSQHIHGVRTHIEWTKEKTVFPRVEGSRAGGAAIFVRGITGEIRGAKHKTPEGVVQRPDFAFIDDMQTDKSAKTDGQCEHLLGLVHKAVLKCAGHRKTIAAVMNATIIRKGDAIDQIATDSKYRAWQVERIPMVRQWADAHDDFWLGEYKDTRRNFDPDILDDNLRAEDEANALYLANRERADAGCVVAWRSCYDEEKEHSAIQHAYNFLIDDGEEVFASECQQDPLDRTADLSTFDFADVISRSVNIERRVIPANATKLTSFIDISEDALWWVVCAWSPGFTGHIVDYGVWPDNGPYTTLASLKTTIRDQMPGAGLEAGWRNALHNLTLDILGKEYHSEAGNAYRVARCMIDANYNKSRDVVDTFCRRSTYSPILMPSFGATIGKSGRPFNDVKAKPKPGEVRGKSWRISRHASRVMSIRYDVNFWKSFVAERIGVAIGDPSAMTIYKGSQSHHKMLAEQLTAEFPRREPTSAGGEVDIWEKKPGKSDEHFWDCLVGCAVAASTEGASLEHEPAATKRKRPRRTLAQMAAGK